MAKILQIIDVDSDGHKVRLDDGRLIVMPHGGEHPHVGQEVSEPKQSEAGEALGPEVDLASAARIQELEEQLKQERSNVAWLESQIEELVSREIKAPTIEQLNSKAQAQAQALSEIVKQNESEPEK